MARPAHVDQSRIEHAVATALRAAEQPINTGQMVRATETLEEAVAEREYFRDPANAANIGRIEALHYAWQADLAIRNYLRPMGMTFALMSVVMLSGLPWRSSIPYTMQMWGVFGAIPVLFGAIWFRRPRAGFERCLPYQVRAAPLLVTAGVGLVAIGLLGTWLARSW